VGNGSHAAAIDLRSDTVTRPTEAMREAAFNVRAVEFYLLALKTISHCTLPVLEGRVWLAL